MTFALKTQNRRLSCQDVYSQIIAISTIAAVVCASVALLLMNFSRSDRTVQESRSWLKRIIISWAILNGLLGVLVFTAPVAFALGASQSTSNIFKSWCRMFAGQLFLLLMNAWCLRLFTTMVGTFIANPLSL